jgi:IS5 family transposase
MDLDWMHPTLKAEVFALLEAKILSGKQFTGRTSMDLWRILVLGVVRLRLEADWDRMEHVAKYDSLVRQMLGVPATPWGEDTKVFGHQTLRDNVALLDAELLQQINTRIALPDARCSQKKPSLPSRRLSSRWTAMCWRPTCVSRPTGTCSGTRAAKVP